MQTHIKNADDSSIIIIDDNQLLGIDNDIFQRTILNIIEEGNKNIFVDLSNVKFISSVGIEGFLHAFITCTNNNVNFSLKNVDEKVKTVLSTLKLNKIFNVI